MKVIYIAGSGRTGSTLLSLLLSQRHPVANLGQIRDLPGAIGSNAPCSCGTSVPDCPFWGNALASVYGGSVQTELRKLSNGLKKFRRQYRKSDWARQSNRARLAQQNEDFLKRMSALYHAAAKAADASVLVDSSKSPEIAAALSLTGDLDLVLVNLVRDPRAIAVSWVKRNDDFAMARKSAQQWSKRQRELRRFDKIPGIQFITLRYEDFTAQPQEYLELILAHAGEPGSYPRPIEARKYEISWRRQHLFPPANEKILSSRPTETTIIPSAGWRHRRHWRERFVATCTTFPLNLKYGYGLF